MASTDSDGGGDADYHRGVTPRVRIRSIPRGGFSTELLRDLHALSTRLMAEEFDRFRIHAETNDVVHVFERVDVPAIVGFQFWKTAPIDLPRARAIVGGKLRILPEFRGRALHLRSGLRFYVEAQLRHPRTRFYRLSLASIFGFTSIASALAEYRLFEPRPDNAETRAVTAVFHQLAEGSHYEIDPASGLFAVRIFMTAETLAQYPDRFFDKPAARAYAAANPDFRTNGCYVGFWFRFTPRNLRSLLRAIGAARRLPARAGRPDQFASKSGT
jgi:hypothetical protein